MGNLVDLFVMKLKPEWQERKDECKSRGDEIILNKRMVISVPAPYRQMFTHLLERYSLEAIVSTERDREYWGRVWDAAAPYETNELRFARRFRDESLMQIIRKTFFDTLLIIENHYDSEKQNCFLVTYGNPISEEEWPRTKSVDQLAIESTKTEMEVMGFKFYEIDELAIVPKNVS
jgi:hypothetical protein